MNRKALIAAAGAAAVLAAAPAAASAATVKGTVVARDADRGTVVTVARGGDAKTLRVKRAGSYKPGQRVHAKATVAADGTYRAARVKRRGRAASAKLKATVVRRQAGRYVVSAGGSTFALRAARGRATAAAAGALEPGAIVEATLRLRKGAAAAHDVEQVGIARGLELEGIFLGLEEGTLRLAVEGAGEVKVAVPSDVQVTADPGDEVELLVAVSDAGFTLIALQDDGDGGFEFESEDGEAEITGVISAIGDASITVDAGPGAQITCSVPVGTDLSGFAVGDEVEMACSLRSGVFTVLEIESDEAELEFEEQEQDEEDDENEESEED